METLPTSRSRLAVRAKPPGTPSMFQNWRNLLFLHWEYDRASIEKTLPPGLHVDTFRGRTYVGVVPFFMKDVRPAFLPSIPGFSSFLELNVRTYVYDDSGTPGVWFYSLDCNQPLAVWGARKFYYLPYKHAEMKATVENGITQFCSIRKPTPAAHPTKFRYAVSSALSEAAPDTLEFFLIERYVLFSRSQTQKRLYTARVHHQPYPLNAARLDECDAEMLKLNGLSECAREPDHVIFSAGVDVEIYGLEPSSASPVAARD